MSQPNIKKDEYYYSFNWKDLINVQTNYVDLFDSNNNKVGFLVTDRFKNTHQEPPSGFTFTPYTVNKTIFTKDGILYFSGIVVENFPIVGGIIEKIGIFNNAISVDRLILSIQGDIVNAKIIVLTNNN
jgi:hypothetical protein